MFNSGKMEAERITFDKRRRRTVKEIMTEPPGGGHGMSANFEYKGVWFLPENPGNKMAGTLRFSPHEGAILELIGSFKGVENMLQLTDHEIILGYCGKMVTLYECREIGFNIGTHAVQRSNFRAKAVFLDAHFQKKEDVKFKRIAVHYSHLDEWVHITGFEIIRPIDKKGITVNYLLPDSIEMTEFEGWKMAIEIKAEGPRIPLPQREVAIKERTFIAIESQEEKSFEKHFEMAEKLQNFLSLATMSPTRPEIFYGFTKTCAVTKEDKTIYPAVEAVFCLAFSSETTKSLMPDEMLFNYSDIKGKTSTVLKNWLNKQEKLKPIFDLYFSTMYNPHLYLENEFLSIVQAVESYHRRTMKNFDLAEDEHKKRIDAILNVTPQQHKEWLDSHLEYSNEPKLRKRLKELFKEGSDVMGKFAEESESLIQKTLDTRNYLTHYDEKLRSKAATGQELYMLTFHLKMLLETAFLKELGMDKDTIKTLVERNRVYERISRV